MKDFNAKNDGFTLAETLVYAGILSILVLTVLSFFVWAIRFNTKIKAMREVLDNTRRVMEIITFEVKGAKSIYTPTTTQNQLSLETMNYLSEGETTTFIDFYLCDKSLCLKKESQEAIALTSERVKVNTLKFIVIGVEPSSVQIELGISFEDRFSINLNSAVSLRP